MNRYLGGKEGRQTRKKKGINEGGRGGQDKWEEVNKEGRKRERKKI